MNDPTIWRVKTRELLDEPAADDNVSVVFFSDYKPLRWLCDQQKARIAVLETAARALIARWDTPAWKDAPATAEYINALRKALGDTDG